MYLLNNVLLVLTRTYTFQGTDSSDERDGLMCAELRSPDGRYYLNTDMDTFSKLKASEGNATSKGRA